MRRIIEILGLNGGNNGAGQLSLPMGLDFIRFFLDPGDAAATAAMYSTLRLFANSEMLREYTGAQQDAMNFVDKIPQIVTQADGIMEIPLEMIGMKKVEAQYSTTLNTFSPDPVSKVAITSARLELITAGMNGPAFRVYCEVDDAGEFGPGAVERVRLYGPFPMTNNTEASISSGDKMPYGTLQNRYWRRFLVNYPGHNVNLARILKGKDNAEILHLTKAIETRFYAAGDSVRTLPEQTVFQFLWDSGFRGISEPIDTMELVGGSLQKLSNLDVRLTGDSASNANILLSTIGIL